MSNREQAWPSVDPDSYLDLRQPDWLEAEQRGDVVYRRKPGEQRSHVSVHPAREEILAALRVKPATVHRRSDHPGAPSFMYRLGIRRSACARRRATGRA